MSRELTLERNRRSRLIALLAIATGIDKDQIGNNTKLLFRDGWDSLDRESFLTILDGEFRIKISFPEDPRFLTVDQCLRHISRLIREKEEDQQLQTIAETLTTFEGESHACTSPTASSKPCAPQGLRHWRLSPRTLSLRTFYPR